MSLSPCASDRTGMETRRRFGGGFGARPSSVGSAIPEEEEELEEEELEEDGERDPRAVRISVRQALSGW